MRVLVFTTVYPTPQRPLLGLFVAERIRHTLPKADVEVVAPLPWFRWRPARSLDAANGSSAGGTFPRARSPLFWYVPKLFKPLDPLLLALSAAPTIARLRRRFPFDLIDAHFGYPDGVAAALLGRWFSRPVVVTLRGAELDFARSPLHAKQMAWALSRAKQVVAVSHELERLAHQLGVPSERIRTIPNGVDTDFFVPPSPAGETRSNLPAPRQPTILAVGHLVPVKGFPRLIEAMALLRERQPGVRLVIVGGAGAGTEEHGTRLRRMVEALHLDGTVSFTGPLPRERVLGWLQQASVFALASHREGCPNVVLEALACGVPVVATEVGEVSDLVPSFAGLVIPADATPTELAESLQQALTRTWDRLAIRRYAEGLNWGEVARRTIRMWSHATRGGSASR